MRYAVFADIHGNLEALETALEYAQKRRLAEFLVLGDSLGYGANPNECLEWALEHAGLHVFGNHEAAIHQNKVRENFTDWAREAIDWTARMLKTELADRIKDLPYLQIAGKVTLAHGTLHSPEKFHYLIDLADARKSFLTMQTPVGFVGHTHIPAVFSEKEPVAKHLKEGVLKLQKNERYLLNPGSIGQSRDRDRRLSFGIFDDDELTFEIVRLSYDNKKAADKILAEGLPAFLAYRLL
jgi:diadenosine tetraphosphatase ApaH/serine/threonine PP2A family protein phosphatase